MQKAAQKRRPVNCRLFNALDEPFQKFVKVVAVNEYGLLDSFAVSHCAAYTVHADRLKNFSAVGIDLEAINDERILGYFSHKIFLLIDNLFNFKEIIPRLKKIYNSLRNIFLPYFKAN